MLKKATALFLILIIFTTFIPNNRNASHAIVSENYKFTINGITVEKDSAAHTGNCWTYANAIYKLVWNKSFTSNFYGSYTSDYNMLRNLDGSNRTLTAYNAKRFVTAAPVGSVIRITWNDRTDTNDSTSPASNPNNPGHNIIIAEKNENGFFGLEDWYNRSVTTYYTWDTFVGMWGQNTKYGYTYFKYIKYPQAAEYSENAVSNPIPVVPSQPTQIIDLQPPVLTSSQQDVVQNQQITISWNSVQGAVSYDYFLTEFPEDYAYTDFTRKARINENYVNFSDLPVGKYTIFVHAVASNGNQSIQSNWLSFNVNPSSVTPQYDSLYNGHQYQLFDISTSWTYARDFCTQLGGNLVVINDSEESTFIKKFIDYGKNDAYWLGANNIDNTGFKWITNDPLLYSDWYPGEPNGVGEKGKKEAFAEIRKSYDKKWNDVHNTNRESRGFIMELPTNIIVGLNTDGGNIEKLVLTYTNQTNYGVIPKPVKENHIFLGWYSDFNKNILVNDYDSITQYSDHILYAKWEPVKQSSIIKLQIDNHLISVNGNSYNIDSQFTVPIILNNRTLLPVKAVIEAMGGYVVWHSSDKTIELIHPNGILNLQIGNTIAWHDQGIIKMDTSPITRNGRTLLPIKYIVDFFGGNVEWDQNTKTVTIIY